MDLAISLLGQIFFVIVFLYALDSLGGVVLKLLQADIDDFPYRALTGLLIILTITWFTRDTGFALGISSALSLLSLLILLMNLLSDSRYFQKRDGVSVIATVIFVTGCTGYVTKGGLVAVIGNNDLFNWYSVAAHFAGEGNYFNMAPAASGSFRNANLHIDGFGTVWFLILAAMGSSKLILSAQVAVNILLCWIALSIRSQLSIFIPGKQGLITAFSWLIISSPLLMYIAFNGFFAHMLATVVGGILVSSVLRTTLYPSLSWRIKFMFFLVPCGALLLIYQSGFVVFQFFGVGLLMVVGFMLWRSNDTVFTVKYLARDVALPYFLAIISSMAIFYESTIYLFHRTVQVANAQAGWALPPESPVFYALLSIIIILIAVRLSRVQGINSYRVVIFGALLFFSFLVTAYFIWLILGLSPYQNWKFASFFLYTLSFAVAVPFIKCVDEMLISTQRFVISKMYLTILFSSILISFLALSISYVINYRNRIVVFDKHIEDLFGVKTHMKAGVPVILDLPPYSYSMLAMQILSKNNQLFPLAKTYIPAAQLTNSTGLESPMLLQLKEDASCHRLEIDRITYESPLYTLGYPVNLELWNPTQLKFDFTSKCQPEWLNFMEGLSGWESWGRWTNGKRLVFKLIVPKGMRDKPVHLEFDVAPYLPSNVTEQRMVIFVNGQIITSRSLKAREVVNLDLPAEMMNRDDIEVAFDLPDATSPSAHGSSDPRQLAVAFYSLRMIRS